jgi:hypothetical protein
MIADFFLPLIQAIQLVVKVNNLLCIVTVNPIVRNIYWKSLLLFPIQFAKKYIYVSMLSTQFHFNKYFCQKKKIKPKSDQTCP